MKRETRALSERLQSALDLHQRGLTNEARSLYLLTLEENPEDFDARLLLTALEGQCKNYSEALTHISKALETDASDPQLHHNQGLLLFELSRFEQSVASFTKAIELEPHLPQTLYSRGKAFTELSQLKLAQQDFIACIRLDLVFVDAWLELGNLYLKEHLYAKASKCFWSGLLCEPSHAALWCNLGNALTAQLLLPAAQVAYEISLRLNALDSKTHFQMGLALQSSGQSELALIHFKQALALDPSVAAYFYASGLVYLQLSQWTLAIEALSAGIKLNPQHAEAYYNRGLAQQQLGQYDLALESFNKAIYWRGDFAQAHYSRGIVFYELKFYEMAIKQYDLALQYQPNYFEALTNKGIAQKELKQLSASLENYQRALSINPEFSQAFNNLGNVRLDLHETQLALECFNHALSLQPSNVIALTNRANIYHDLKDFERATKSYELAIMVDPSHVDAYWNLALSQLSLGQYEKGWTLYEHRWSMPNFSVSTRQLKEPLWLGDVSLSGKTLLIQAEQGLGDSLQFCRFISDVLSLGARVKLEVPTPLLSIMRESFPLLECITDQAAEVGEFDLHCPLMSLPKALGVTLESLGRAKAQSKLPAHQHLHYLKAPEEGKAHFREWLHVQDSLQPSNATQKSLRTLRVGLVWRGNPKHQNDLNRSLSLTELIEHLPLSDERFQFISLQKDIPDEELALLQKNSNRIANAASELIDFTDTASLITHLDLVICVDTSIAHLSGALMCQTWVLLAANPDWRWLFNRDDSPWYPSVRLFRQKQLKQWGPLLSSISTELLKLAGDPRV